MKYSEVLQYVLAGKLVRKSKNHGWMRMEESGLWDTNQNRPDILLEREDYSADTWEVREWEVKEDKKS